MCLKIGFFVQFWTNRCPKIGFGQTGVQNVFWTVLDKQLPQNMVLAVLDK